MSKIKLPLRRLNLVLAILSLFLSIHAKENLFIGEYTQEDIKHKLDNLHASVDLKLTPEVKKYLRDYIVSYRQSSEKLIGRSLIYFPDIENKLSSKSMPSEIKFLSVIESSLKPDARSRVGAVGLWQFMKATAKMYGLKIDRHVDERKDVEKSTEAALTYLADLNERFGDWTLALAAYNCGPGNVRKAMRRSGGSDYWSIRNYLPRETRNYVPKFIAMTYLMNYYHDHDLSPDFPEELFVKTRKAVLHDHISFASISKITGLEEEVIEYYNPTFIGRYVPKSDEGNLLVLPTEEMYLFLSNYSENVTLVPDPLQDLVPEISESEMASESRAMIEIATIEPIVDLANIELIHSSTHTLHSLNKEDARIRQRTYPINDGDRKKNRPMQKRFAEVFYSGKK